MGATYALFRDYQPKKNGPVLTAVFLIDGCMTAPRNCYMREYGIVWYKPLLFATRGGAKNYLHKHHPGRRDIRIAKYDGPTEPWDRESADAANDTHRPT